MPTALAGSADVNANYKSYLTLAGAAALAQLFVLLVSPIVTRLYSPESFGAFGLLLAAGTVLGAVGTGRLEHAIPVAKSRLQALRVFALGAVSITTVAATAAAGISSLVLFEILGETVWAGLPVLSIPLIAVGVGFYQLANANLLRQRRYARVSANKIFQGFSTGTLQVLSGLITPSPVGLVLAHTIGYLTGCLAGGRALLHASFVVHRRMGFLLKGTLKRFQRFPFVLAPAALLNQLSQHVPVLAIGYAYGLHEAGLYAFVLRVCGAPSSLVGQAVGQVYASDVRAVLRLGKGAMAARYWAIVIRMFAAGIPIVGGLVLTMMVADEFIFGSEWAGLGVVAACLSAKLLVDFATTPVAMTLGYLEQQRTQLVWDVGRLCAVILMFIYIIEAGLTFPNALLAFSFVWAAGQLVLVYVAYRACRAHGQYLSTDVTVAR